MMQSMLQLVRSHMYHQKLILEIYLLKIFDMVKLNLSSQTSMHCAMCLLHYIIYIVDLWIVGAGILGSIVAKKWRKQFPDAVIRAEVR